MICYSNRVEIDHQDMIEASEFAESLPGHVRVLGWYHSHPRITVNPSHVDLRTQANYQMMDSNFVGLIFSVFSYDVNKNMDRKEAIAFQSQQGACNYIAIEIESQRTPPMANGLPGIDATARLPEILKQEELTDCSTVCSEGYDPLAMVHNRGCLVTQLSNQTSIVTIPLLEAAQARKQYLLKHIASLKTKKEKLTQELGDIP